jgi:tetrahydromethanopterin S-methyltransferase subunit C
MYGLTSGVSSIGFAATIIGNLQYVLPDKSSSPSFLPSWLWPNAAIRFFNAGNRR